MEIIATREIAEGEKVLLNYGNEWETAWQAHVAAWQPHVDAVHYQLVVGSIFERESPDFSSDNF